MRVVALLGFLGVLSTLSHVAQGEEFAMYDTDPRLEEILRSVPEDSFADGFYDKDLISTRPIVSRVQTPTYDQVIITQFKRPREKVHSLNGAPWSNYRGRRILSFPNYRYPYAELFHQSLRSRRHGYPMNDFDSWVRPRLLKRSLTSHSKAKSSKHARRANTKACPGGHLDHDGNCVKTPCPFRDADGECSTKPPAPCNIIDKDGKCHPKSL